MNKYYKEVDGVKEWFRGILLLNDKQIINPSEEVLLSNGYIKYEITKEEVILSEEQKLKNVRDKVLLDLETYDNSSSVNICNIKYQNTLIPYWANKSERNDLKSALKDCISLGIAEYRLDLRDIGISINIECNKLLQLLSTLEIYAIHCYNTTTDHIFNINQLSNIEEIEQYDYTKNYPEIITFEL